MELPMDAELAAEIRRELSALTCDYAFYYRPHDEEPLLIKNRDLFLSASIIKVPILFAWAYLERSGRASRDEICELDLEPQVEGAGLSWLLQTRRLPFGDVLLLMIALSDNLCTNLVIRRIGIERLNAIFRGPLGLPDARIERRLFDDEARARGLDNYVSAADCVQLYRLRDELTAAERAWIEPMLLANADLGLWLRSVERDTVEFYHKTGNIPGVLHDWGYTRDTDLFLLTQNVKDEGEVYDVLSRLGPKLLLR
jgi:beta-lactamase class A